MCLYPRLIQNKKYTKTKKNGGNIPAVTDIRVTKVPVGCGKCIECMKQKKREWQVRLLEEVKHAKNGKFITLTFSNESIKKLICENEDLQKLEGYPLDNAIATKAVRLWLERWRKKFGKSLKHWLVTELGHNGTENIHLHGIVWTDKTESLTTTWQYGYIWTGKGEKRENYVNEKTVNYIIKYITKQDIKHKEYKPKILTSPGIGSAYALSENSKRNIYNEKGTNETYTTRTGHRLMLPIYLRNKIYTENEREKLWLEKLDKGEIWICGEKIKINDQKTHYNVLKYHRERNTKLGYGNDEKNWEQEIYENELRKINYEKRINKIKNESKNKQTKTN